LIPRSPLLHALALLLATCWSAAAAPRPLDPPAQLPRLPLDEGMPATSAVSALERYVRFDDGAFTWSHHAEQKIDGATVHHLRVTSQRWRSDAEVDRPLWQHWVSIGVPDTIRSNLAILIIGGGRHRDQPPASVPAELSILLRAAGAVVIHVDNVPNQPLKLEGEDAERFEDNLVARSWVLAMRDDDASWIVRFPMVKAAVKAMDAAEAFLAEKQAAGVTGAKPAGFFVVGASKRGWTTWLTAAVDPRVKGIAPMVIDVLNMRDHTPHHWRSYGFWAPTLKDYENNGIPAKFGSPELARVIAHEDPLAYLSRVAGIPKYIVNATGDEFFPTDSLRHYEDKIPGVWRARCVPNAGHSLRNTAAPLEILAFYRSVAKGKQLPEMTWSVEPAIGDASDRLVVRLSEKPLSVTVWESTNEKARDFRFNNGAGAWTDTIIAPADASGLVYAAVLSKPPAGWRGTLVECRFPGAGGAAEPLVFTTRVFITPDTLPFELPQAK
jgi:PhoPQ-activated pathogenicity-related protein